MDMQKPGQWGGHHVQILTPGIAGERYWHLELTDA